MRIRIRPFTLLLAGLMLTPPVAADTVIFGSADGQGRASAAPVAPGQRSAWIGVWLVDEIDGGARIVALVPGGPAEVADLQVGDIIVQANARPVSEQDTLSGVLRALEPGARLQLQLLRGGKGLQRSLQVAARPTRPVAVRGLARAPRGGLDIEVSEITPALREHYGAPAAAGVLVVRVDPAGLGGRSGVRVGDVLVSVADRPIVDARQVEWLDRQPAPDTIEVEIVREGKRQAIRLAALETRGREAQDGEDARRRVEREVLVRRLTLELERLERRMDDIRRELERLQADEAGRR